MAVVVGPIRVANGETSKRRIEHAVAVPWGGLQATKRPRALAMVAPLANLVLRSPNGTNRLRALPWAPSILGIVAAVILDRLVLGVPVRRYPQRAVIDDFLRIRRWKCLPVPPIPLHEIQSRSPQGQEKPFSRDS